MEQETNPNMLMAGVEAAAQDGEEAIEHPEFDKQIAGLQAKVDMKAEEIRTDASLDDGEKSRQIQHLYNEAKEAKQVFEKRYEQQLAEESAEAEKKVFHVIPSERDSVRAAYNEVYNATTLGFESGDGEGISYAREELERLAERAVRTGDTALAKAVFHVATERGEQSLRDRYLASHPEKQRAWEDYTAKRRKLADFQNPQERLWRNLTGSWALRKPPEA